MLNSSSPRKAARLLRALGHQDRLRIVLELARSEACVCHLTATLGLRQAAVSQHLAVLRRAGIVKARRDGLYVLYRLANPRVPALLDAVGLQPVPPTPPGPTSCRCPRCAAGAAAGWLTTQGDDLG
ncbi:ArsR/SmtB family transcription factor [Carboxydichorda subterranea]|uniref:ArsR/SmtB family transcription factor n=1 Tax=Carboxydichorda subterranea TaxID=3109565 RepID=UPI003857181C